MERMQVDKQRPRKFAFLCYSSDYFLSHFGPALNAARLQGFELVAFLPTVPAGDNELLRDVTIVPIGTRRKGLPFLRPLSDFISVASAIRKYRPDVIQAFSMQ